MLLPPPSASSFYSSPPHSQFPLWVQGGTIGVAEGVISAAAPSIISSLSVLYPPYWFSKNINYGVKIHPD